MVSQGFPPLFFTRIEVRTRNGSRWRFVSEFPEVNMPEVARVAAGTKIAILSHPMVPGARRADPLRERAMARTISPRV